MIVPKIKICGIMTEDEAEFINDNNIDFVGMVLFFEKSKRNIDIENAKNIIKAINKNIKKVAVVVSPTIEQVEKIQKIGFDILQIHKNLSNEVLKYTDLEIFRAFNICDKSILNDIENCDKISTYVFDGKDAGSGLTFDWSLIKNFNKCGKKIMLAGGLNSENVIEAIKYINPDIVDTSTGVENDNGIGKSSLRIKKFVESVRSIC